MQPRYTGLSLVSLTLLDINSKLIRFYLRLLSQAMDAHEEIGIQYRSVLFQHILQGFDSSTRRSVSSFIDLFFLICPTKKEKYLANCLYHFICDIND
jgi:hypothetical protein